MPIESFAAAAALATSQLVEVVVECQRGNEIFKNLSSTNGRLVAQEFGRGNERVGSSDRTHRTAAAAAAAASQALVERSKSRMWEAG